MKISGDWVGYIDRTREQIENSVLQRVAAQVPELTDHSLSGLWRKWLRVWGSVFEMLGYYVDNRAREAFLPSCRKFESAVKIAQGYDYRVRGAVPNSVDLTFELASPLPSDTRIPQATRCQTATGKIYATLDEVVITAGQTQVSQPARQWARQANITLGTSEGTPDQEFVLPGNVVDQEIEVRLGTEVYTPQDTLAYSRSADLHFVAGLNERGEMQLRFGDDITGRIPTAGTDILVDYYITEDVTGGASAGAINEIIDAVNVPDDAQGSPGELSVTNPLAAAGAKAKDSLLTIKRNLPIHLRTLFGTITRDQYASLPTLAPGVAKSNYSLDESQGVIIYIVPETGGVASSDLLESTRQYSLVRSSFLVDVTVLPAGELEILIGLEADVLPGFLRSRAKSSVLAALSEFFSFQNQEIGGSVFLGNIYQVLENLREINHSTITYLTARPFARIVAGSRLLNWSVEPDRNYNQTHQWRIRMVSESEFELIIDRTFEGVFPVETALQRNGLTFTIHPDNYQSGDEWGFVSYAVGSGIVLFEPSIPVLRTDNVTITLTGGINS